MILDEIRNACRVLDLDFQALDLKVLKERYWSLMKIYRSESMASLPLTEDLDALQRARLLEDIESSYRLLEGYCSQGNTLVASEPVPAEQPANPLVNFRKLKNISIGDLAARSGLSEAQVCRLEEERFEQLPPFTYIKLFLRKIAPVLELSPEKLLRYYEKCYQDWQRKTQS